MTASRTTDPTPPPPVPMAGMGGFAPLPVLDGIRALAVMLVFVAHAGLDKLVPGGLGVTVFFFLSGYLITSLMRVEFARYGTIHIRHFYLRRVLRIFPPLYITLALGILCVVGGVYAYPLTVQGVLLQAFQLSNYTLAQVKAGGVPAMPLWSLAVEEHFYLLFPCVYLCLLARRSGAGQARWLLFACGITLAIRILSVGVLANVEQVYNWTHTRIDSLLFGCILAVWSNPVLDADTRSYVPRLYHAFLAAAALLGCLLIRSEIFRQTLRYTIQGAALFVLFSYVIRQKHGPIFAALTHPALTRVGVWSYTIYLSHYFILSALAVNFPAVSPLVRAACGLVLSLGYAGVMYRYVERPLARRRARLH